MSDSTTRPIDSPPTPGEQADVAQTQEEQQVAPSEGDDTVVRQADVTDLPAHAATAERGLASPPAESGVEVEVECPGCGMVLVGDSPRPTAAWFCPRCDYPVFWASPPPEPSAGQKRARRRLPGTSGKEVLGAGPCWNCGEMNDPGITACLRCAATLPKPVAPEIEPIVVTVEVERPVAVPYVAPSATWPFVAAGVTAGASLAIAGTLWVLRAAGLLFVGASLGGS